MTPDFAPCELEGDSLAAHMVGALDIRREPEGVRPTRLPSDLRRQLPDAPTEWVVSQTAGVRLRARTAATWLRVSAHFTRHSGPDAPPRPAVLVAEVDGVEVWRGGFTSGTVIRGSRTGLPVETPGRAETWDIPLPGSGVERVVTLWLPHRAQTTLRRVEADAPLRHAEADVQSRWIHHGSSISHGHEADAPTTTWTRLAARELDLDLLDLGFSGSAMLDGFTARTIARERADLITLKLGINVVNTDAMRPRAFSPAAHAFLDTIRDGHPETPMAVITAIVCPEQEHLAGPSVRGPDGRFRGTPRPAEDVATLLTLARTRELLDEVVRVRKDPNLTLWDGRSLLGSADVTTLGDGLHPDQAGHRLIAARFAAMARADRLTGPVVSGR